jgi:hypothetical protein
MKKFIFLFLLFGALLLTLFCGLFVLPINQILKDEILNDLLEHKICELPIDTCKINIIIAGDSRAERQLSPQIMRKYINCNIINIAVSSCDLVTVVSAIKKMYPVNSKIIFVISASPFLVNDGITDPLYSSLNMFQKMTFLEKLKVYHSDLIVMLRLQIKLINSALKTLIVKWFHLKPASKIGEFSSSLGFYGVKGKLRKTSNNNSKSISSFYDVFIKNANISGVRWKLFVNSIKELGAMKCNIIIYQPPISPYWRKVTRNSELNLLERNYSSILSHKCPNKYNVGLRREG